MRTLSTRPEEAVLDLEPRGIEAKIAAFKCHKSQAPLFGFFEETVRKCGRK